MNTQIKIQRDFGTILGDTVGGFIAGGPAGAAAGLIGGVAQGQQQQNQLQLGEAQVQNSETLMDYNEQKQLDFWKQTSYPGQVAELEQAGLNPALLYGHGGAGGMTMPGAPSAGLGMAPQSSAPQMTSAMMQLSETQADVDLKKAQADNIRAQTPHQGELMEANINNLNAGTTNLQAQTTLNDIAAQTQRLDNTIKSATLDDQVATIKSTAEKVETEADILVRNNWIDQNTMKDKIAIVHATMLGTFLQNNLTQAQTQNQQQQVQTQIQTLKNNFLQIMINDRNADTQKQQLDLQKFVQDLPVSDQKIIDGVTDLIQTFMGSQIPHTTILKKP